MSYFNMVCDSCGREVSGCNIVNGMKFCAKCYQETFGNNTGKFADLLNSEMYELKISNLEYKLNEKEQRIAELEEQLKNAIVPKFKIGQDIFFIDNEYQITQGVVDIILTGQDVFEKWCKYSIDLGTEYEDDIRFVDKDEEEIFATKKEARKRLEELKGK